MDLERSNTAAKAGPAAAPTTATVGIERLIKRKGRALPANLVLDVADWVHAERRRLGLTQAAMARRHGVPERQIATYDAIAKWSAAAKSFVRANTQLFGVSALTRLFANRSWRTQGALLTALERYAAGELPVKPRKVRSNAVRDPDLIAFQDRMRDRLQARIVLSGDGRVGEIRISYGSAGELERLAGILGV